MWELRRPGVLLRCLGLRSFLCEAGKIFAPFIRSIRVGRRRGSRAAFFGIVSQPGAEDELIRDLVLSQGHCSFELLREALPHSAPVAWLVVGDGGLLQSLLGIPLSQDIARLPLP